MAVFQIDELVGLFCKALTYEVGSIEVDNFDTWLFTWYPHIRVQCIGDEPMLWFSVSRCNPPSEDMLAETVLLARSLNWTMMTSIRILYDLEPSEQFALNFKGLAT